MATVKPPSVSDLTSLPFDQYSRQFLVAQLINSTLRPNKKTTFKLIDLGGHKGKTKDFLPADDVTILDVFDEAYPGYVKGDATKMTFADNAFDIAVSFDVFEHIPRESRQAFINEALRVSRLGVFVALPIDSAEGAVSGAEQLLNTIYKNLYSEDHPWLKEHIDYRIPEHKELVDFIQKAGAESVSLASNQVTDWELLQTIIFTAARNRHLSDVTQGLNRWYNRHVDQLELGVEPGYRRIYFITKDKQQLARVEKSVEALVNAEEKKSHRYLKVHESTLAETLKAVADIGIAFNSVAKEKDELVSLQTQAGRKAAELEARNAQLVAELDKVRGSLSWRITQPLRTFMKLFKR